MFKKIYEFFYYLEIFNVKFQKIFSNFKLIFNLLFGELPTIAGYRVI